jgi:uncharacterized protein
MLSAMKLNEGRSGPASQLIRSYGPAGVTVGSGSHPLPVLVTASAVEMPFDARCLADLDDAHLQEIFARHPAIVLIGSAAGRWQPPAALRHAFEERRIALESMDLGAACRTFNVLAQEDREVLALLFP